MKCIGKKCEYFSLYNSYSESHDTMRWCYLFRKYIYVDTGSKDFSIKSHCLVDTKIEELKNKITFYEEVKEKVSVNNL